MARRRINISAISLHFDGGLHAGKDIHLFECVLQRKRIDDCGEHAHVIGGHSIKTLGACCQATKDVSTADDNSNLDAERMNIFDLAGNPTDDIRIDAEALLAHKSLAAQLQKDATEFKFFTHPELL